MNAEGLVQIGRPRADGNGFAALRLGQDKAREALEQQRRFRPDIYWYLTFRCNLACKHCWVNSSPWVDTSQDLTYEDALGVVDQMAELNVRMAILSGGEVLIWPRALDIIETLADRGIYVSIESNGLRFSERFAETARRLQARNRFFVTVSLDGGTAATHERLRGENTFERTINGLRFLKARGIQFSMQAVLNRTNYGTIPNLFDIAQELQPECRNLQFAFLNPIGRGRDLVHQIGLRFGDYNAIFELIKRGIERSDVTAMVKTPPATVPPRYLGMVFKNPQAQPSVSCQFPLLGILPNGDITICALSREDENLHFGNVKTHRLKDVWQRARMEMLRSRYVSAEHLTGICGDCIWKYQCKGGCRAWAYEHGGSFDAPLPLCAALDEAGEFPDCYRISAQNALMARQAAQLQASAGCACAA